MSGDGWKFGGFDWFGIMWIACWGLVVMAVVRDADQVPGTHAVTSRPGGETSIKLSGNAPPCMVGDVVGLERDNQCVIMYCVYPDLWIAP